jgi:inward rectifier potassium channel
MSKLKNVIDRMRNGEDIGLDRSAQKGRQRTINEDGSYNMERITGKFLGNYNPYHWVITTYWTHYWLVVFSFYTVMNILFATAYYHVGVEQLSGMRGDTPLSHWLYCFFFSAQSFTTVGYGGIHPIGEVANFLATLEAFIGLMTFALATGTLYGRFSKPVSKIKYSKNILIAPFRDGLGMQFMVANELSSTLMEMEARINVSWMEVDEQGVPIRRFQQVKLEYDKIAMFPTSWIINHPIEEDSALYGKSIEDIRSMDFEIFVLLKGFDDVFSQTIYSRHSYMASSFVWGGKFKRPFSINEEGKLIMDLTKVGEYDLVSLQQELNMA